MEVNSYERIDLSGNVTGDLLSGELSEGEWKVMIYTLKPDHSSGRNHVDYLNPDDVNRFIELTYEKYYKTFPEHFGKAFFMPLPQVEILRTILNEAQAVWDIRIEGVLALSDGGLSYLHKTQGGRDIYYFANSSDTPVNTPVLIRGNMKLETWDPQTGEIKRCNTSTLTQNGTDITRFQLTLDPVKS
jgi:hypothetical protein